MSSMGLSAYMIPERASSTVPRYCPHAGCPWSYVGGEKKGEGFLAVHLRVVHKGDDPRPPAPEEPARPRVRLSRPHASPAPAKAVRTPRVEPKAAPAPRPVLADGRLKCKTEGCENAANEKYDRGVYFGLCEQACIPARRELFADQIRKGQGRAPASAASNGAAPSENEGQPDAATPAAGAEAPAAQQNDRPLEPLEPLETAPAQSFAQLAGRAIKLRRETLEVERLYLDALRALRRHPDYERLAPVVHDAVERL